MTDDPKLIEAMARRMCSSNGADPDVDLVHENEPSPEWLFYKEDATAALAAIREAGYEVVPIPGRLDGQNT